jgi:hypothetical protein
MCILYKINYKIRNVSVIVRRCGLLNESRQGTPLIKDNWKILIWTCALIGFLTVFNTNRFQTYFINHNPSPTFFSLFCWASDSMNFESWAAWQCKKNENRNLKFHYHILDIGLVRYRILLMTNLILHLNTKSDVLIRLSRINFPVDVVRIQLNGTFFAVYV